MSDASLKDFVGSLICSWELLDFSRDARDLLHLGITIAVSADTKVACLQTGFRSMSALGQKQTCAVH